MNNEKIVIKREGDEAIIGIQAKDFPLALDEIDIINNEGRVIKRIELSEQEVALAKNEWVNAEAIVCKDSALTILALRSDLQNELDKKFEDSDKKRQFIEDVVARELEKQMSSGSNS